MVSNSIDYSSLIFFILSESDCSEGFYLTLLLELFSLDSNSRGFGLKFGARVVFKREMLLVKSFSSLRGITRLVSARLRFRP